MTDIQKRELKLIREYINRAKKSVEQLESMRNASFTWTMEKLNLLRFDLEAGAELTTKIKRDIELDQ